MKPQIKGHQPSSGTRQGVQREADRALDRLRLVVFPFVLGETGTEPTFANVPDLELELGGTWVPELSHGP